MGIEDSDTSLEKVVYHDTMYRTVFEGGFIEPGDWVVWLPGSRAQNDTCAGAFATANAHNDYIHENDPAQSDTHNDPNEQDYGGLVRLGNIDANADMEIFADIELIGGKDGVVDENIGDDDDVFDVSGTEVPESTYTLCLAKASHNGVSGGYIKGSPPPDSHFVHYDYIKLYTQHSPPSPCR